MLELSDIEIDIILEDLKSGNNFNAIKIFRNLDFRIPQMRRAIMGKIGKEEFRKLMRSSNTLYNFLKNNMLIINNRITEDTELTQEEIIEILKLLQDVKTLLEIKKI